MEHDFVSTSIAEKSLGVCQNTLRAWADSGKIEAIRTPGGHRLYNLSKFVSRNQITESQTNEKPEMQNICYCRVSSTGQKDDLDRQVKFMQSQFPNHFIITDIGSGLNFKRKGLQTILDKAFKGLVNTVVVAHRDRLCRFGFDLIEWTLGQHGATLLVLDQSHGSQEQELATDLLSIVHIFSCRINGRRKYGTKRKMRQNQDILPQENRFKNDSPMVQ